MVNKSSSSSSARRFFFLPLLPAVGWQLLFAILLTAAFVVCECSSSSREAAAATTTTTTPHLVLEGVHLPLEKEYMPPEQLHHQQQQHYVPDHDDHDPLLVQNNDHAQKILRFNGAGVRSIRLFGWTFKVYVASFYTSSPTIMDTPDAIYNALSLYDNDDNDLTNAAAAATAATTCTTTTTTTNSCNNQNTSTNATTTTTTTTTILQLDFTFLRAVDQGRVKKAWQEQMKHSIENNNNNNNGKNQLLYEQYENDRDRFIACFGPIANGGTETVLLRGNGQTVIIDQGEIKAILDGRNFQRVFLSMWFGGNDNDASSSSPAAAVQVVAPDLRDGLLGKFEHFATAHHHHHRQHQHPHHHQHHHPSNDQSDLHHAEKDKEQQDISEATVAVEV